jgi:hypothetical protein
LTGRIAHHGYPCLCDASFQRSDSEKYLTASPLKQAWGRDEPPPSLPALPAGAITRVRSRSGPGSVGDSWECSKNDLPHFDSELRAPCGSRQRGRLDLLALQLQAPVQDRQDRSREKRQGITSAAVRRTLVLRVVIALRTKESKRAVDSRQPFPFNFFSSGHHSLQSYCSPYRANGQAPSTALGREAAACQP